MIDIVDVEKMYTEFKLSKGVKVKYTKSGRAIVIKRKPRSICAPHEELKKEQRRILDQDLSGIRLHDSAYGFVHSRTIVDNAEQHINAGSILNIDMKDFFTTVTKKQVYEALVHRRMDKDKAEYISKVCTLRGVLPQGAPTSPTLSNIVAYDMDIEISRLCQESGMKYTRYADDITISADSVEKLIEAKPKVFSIINSFGWKLSGSKVHIVSKNNAGKNQEVTGVALVNKQTKIGKDNIIIKKQEVRKFESTIHHIECEIKDGTLTTRTQLEERYKSLNSLRGYANFLRQTNAKYEHFMDRLKAIGKVLT